jgi:hypothetical protein
MGQVEMVMALVGSVMALVGALAARLGLWCQCRRPSSSKTNTMILDVRS